MTKSEAKTHKGASTVILIPAGGQVFLLDSDFLKAYRQCVIAQCGAGIRCMKVKNIRGVVRSGDHEYLKDVLVLGVISIVADSVELV